MPMILLISSSYAFAQQAFLAYCREDLRAFVPKGSRLLFFPFALSRHDEYCELVQKAFRRLGVDVDGAHNVDLTSSDALEAYDVIFCGGGNTFLLLKELYERQLVEPIRTAVAKGVRYIGSSAGANVACPTIGTTNDMPIVAPESMRALGLVPFNVNAHYYDRSADFHHMGETRRDRIYEFMSHNEVDVIALREGALLLIEGKTVEVRGIDGGIVFRKGPDDKIVETTVAPGDAVPSLLGVEQ